MLTEINFKTSNEPIACANTEKKNEPIMFARLYDKVLIQSR